ncbi:multidrug efflux SMR transporter [Deinococcus sp.]|uniref:DMT family transporter n=1 Tax=Deinococcus sp. TaxID=47478 RepID=UPI00286E2F87|nr:multidrug efflux SMR transporter [Deinococcus sp.]
MNPWLLLGLAIVAEVIGSASLRASEGFTRWLPSVLVVLGYAAAFSLMAQILRTLPLGLTYAVWSGVGTALTAIIGWTFFRDAFHPTALGGIALIILGVVVLNLGGAGHE